MGGWVLIGGASSRTYSPADADLDHHLRAIARYTDRLDPQSQDSAEAATLATVSQRSGLTTTTTTTGGGGGFGGGGGGGGSSSVHGSSIDALFAAGITTGCGTDPLRFCPDRAVTRAQMASFLIRALNPPEQN